MPPHFRKAEDFFAGADEFHGVGGDLRVEEPYMIAEKGSELVLQDRR